MLHLEANKIIPAHKDKLYPNIDWMFYTNLKYDCIFENRTPSLLFKMKIYFFPFKFPFGNDLLQVLPYLFFSF